jgi:hypothetical protein
LTGYGNVFWSSDIPNLIEVIERITYERDKLIADFDLAPAWMRPLLRELAQN